MIKLMFYNRMKGRQSQTTAKPIKIMLYVHEQEDGDEDSFGFEEDNQNNVMSTAEEDDEKDIVDDKIVFKVTYAQTNNA